MFLRRMFILLTLGCLIGATAMAATPDYATLGVTNGQDLGTTVHRHPNGGAGKLVNTHRVPMSGTPEEIAARFVAENAQTLFDAPAAADKAGDVQVGALTFKLVRVTSSMSGDHVWMQAFAGDIPVRGGYVVTHLTHDGQVLFVTNELGDVGFELAASAVSLDRASALAAAARIIGGDGLTRVEPKADLVVLREGNRGRLAWRTETATYNPYGDWEIMVDAANGAELARRDLIVCPKPEEKPASINPPTAPMTPDPMNLGGNKGAKATGTGLAFIANPAEQPRRPLWLARRQRDHRHRPRRGQPDQPQRLGPAGRPLGRGLQHRRGPRQRAHADLQLQRAPGQRSLPGSERLLPHQLLAGVHAVAGHPQCP
jgi:hypothetical protein